MLKFLKFTPDKTSFENRFLKRKGLRSVCNDLSALIFKMCVQ